MKPLSRFIAWFGTNEGRILTFGAIAAEIGAGVHNAMLHQPIELGSFGGGLAAIISAGGVLLAAPPAAKALMAHQQRKLALTEKKND